MSFNKSYKKIKISEKDKTDLINKERTGGYLGRTVQIIPDVTDEIKRWIYISEQQNIDIAICEIGGTVGDIESLPFLEAIRQVGQDKGRDNVIYIHVPLIVEIPGSGELKSKPVQHSVRELNSLGIQPDVLVCRSTQPLTQEIKDKIEETMQYPGTIKVVVIRETRAEEVAK